MVGAVSSSWDPDFGDFFQILTKSGVPGQKNPGPENRKIGFFQRPESGISEVRNPGFTVFRGTDFKIMTFIKDL